MCIIELQKYKSYVFIIKALFIAARTVRGGTSNCETRLLTHVNVFEIILRRKVFFVAPTNNQRERDGHTSSFAVRTLILTTKYLVFNDSALNVKKNGYI